MKIGILTQPLQLNYGGLLQNYALQQTLIRLGHNPITIDQKGRKRPLWYKFLGRIKAWSMYYLNPTLYKKPIYVLNEKEDIFIRKNSIAFIDKYIIHTEKFSGASEFCKASNTIGIEGFVVGSDQCWRPCYNMYLRSMFLDFCSDKQNIKRVAYAASFGTDIWEYTLQETNDCAKLVKLFDFITVREDSGVKLCKDHFGVDAIQVVDPTMLLTKYDYKKIIEENNTPLSSGELFNYVLDPTISITSFINTVSIKTGYKVFEILPKCNEDHRTKEDVKTRINDCVYPSPLAWLRAFMDAKMTIVDSFHGTVFSIIFNKPFWVVGNKERGLSRFSSLLKEFGLEDRMLSENQLEEIDIYKPIDWNKVNSILEKRRTESLSLLKKSLEN